MGRGARGGARVLAARQRGWPSVGRPQVGMCRPRRPPRRPITASAPIGRRGSRRGPASRREV